MSVEGWVPDEAGGMDLFVRVGDRDPVKAASVREELGGYEVWIGPDSRRSWAMPGRFSRPDRAKEAAEQHLLGVLRKA